MNHPTVRFISDCFINPKLTTEESKQPVYLSPWDLSLASMNYIQKGLLFVKPPSFDSDKTQFPDLLQKLKESLSITLIHFYPLAGRLKTLKEQSLPLYTIFIDCSNSPGARFIEASVDLTISDILLPTDVPLIVQSFFDHDRAVNHDGHHMSLLTIQVTELIDGVFIGCSMNHMVGDGTFFWHFLNTWSEIFKENGQNITISRPPIHKRWFPEGNGPIISLPYTHHDQFVSRYEAPPLRERFFHFSTESVARLKAKANAESNSTTISSLQALSTHVWRSVTRIRQFPPDQVTICMMAINDRSRLNPPLPQEYCGNCVQSVKSTTTAGELLSNNLGWAAWKLHQAVNDHSDKVVKEFLESWQQKPVVYQFTKFSALVPCFVMIGSSPRFDMYGNEFGLGRAVALRSGYANKFDGKVSLYPGFEGGNSMDLEVCLSPESMGALECDKEFMETVSI